MDPQWKHPFTAVIAGPSGSGKTVFVKTFLNFIKNMMAPTPEEIVWCYGEWQESYDDLYKLQNNIHFVEGIPDTIDDWKSDKRRLIIIDDLMSETDNKITKLFTKGSHHRNISVMYIIQNIFFQNKEQRTISLNSHYIVVFKNPRDASQITHLAKQMYPGKLKYVQEAYKDATSKPHGYLLIDLRQDTPDHLRLRTDIFPSDQYQVVYVQK